MRAKRKKVKHAALGASAVLLYLLVVTTWMLSGLLARYTARDSGEGLARTAAFSFCVQDEGQKYFPSLEEDIKKPGDTAVYTFRVQNYRDGGSASEVLQTYTLTMTESGSLPIQCKLEQIDKTSGASAKETLVELTAGGEPESQSLKGTLAAGTRESVTYELTVTWPENENDAKYAAGSGVAAVELSVESVQAD